MPVDLLSFLLFLSSSAALEACARGTSRAKEGLKSPILPEADFPMNAFTR
jgi:hypothetical protein